MKLHARELGVDAGIIIICDEVYFDQFGVREDAGMGNVLSEQFDVVPGKYNVEYTILQTNFGTKVKAKGELNITSGKVYVGDPCYAIDPLGWDKFLKDTDMADCPAEGTTILSEMGGDGVFDVDIILTKRKD